VSDWRRKGKKMFKIMAFQHSIKKLCVGPVGLKKVLKNLLKIMHFSTSIKK
jgi:hypothetical protein